MTLQRVRSFTACYQQGEMQNCWFQQQQLSIPHNTQPCPEIPFCILSMNYAFADGDAIMKKSLKNGTNSSGHYMHSVLLSLLNTISNLNHFQTFMQWHPLKLWGLVPLSLPSHMSKLIHCNGLIAQMHQHRSGLHNLSFAKPSIVYCLTAFLGNRILWQNA